MHDAVVAQEVRAHVDRHAEERQAFWRAAHDPGAQHTFWQQLAQHIGHGDAALGRRRIEVLGLEDDPQLAAIADTERVYGAVPVSVESVGSKLRDDPMCVAVLGEPGHVLLVRQVLPRRYAVTWQYRDGVECRSFDYHYVHPDELWAVVCEVISLAIDRRARRRHGALGRGGTRGPH